VTGATHPALELNQHQFVGAIHQREVTNGAIAVAAMVQGEAKGVTAQAANFWITAHQHIEGSAKAGDTSATFRPAHLD
jgi:hypothetical protein